jgi:hypothetical protein
MNDTERIQEAAAWDYHYSELTIMEISKKYAVCKNSVSYYKNKYPKIHFDLPQGPPIERVLIIDELDLDRIEFLFKENKIDYDIPFNFNLELQYNSKI